MLVSIQLYSAVNITSFTANAKPYAFRGGAPNKSEVFSFTAQESDVSGTDGLNTLVFTLTFGAGSAGSGANQLAFDTDPNNSGIVSIDILDSTGASIVTSYTRDNDSQATVDVDDVIAQNSSETYSVHLTMGDAAQLTSDALVPQLQISSGTAINGAPDALGGAGLTQPTAFEITGVDFSVNSKGSGNLIYDADADKFNMLAFKITPQEDDLFNLNTIEVSNSGTAQFDADSTQTNQGVTKVYIYRDENNDNLLDAGDTELKAIETFNNVNATLNSIEIDFSSDGDSFRKVIAETNFLLLYDVGVSSNIEVNNKAHTVKAKITNITGEGVTSSLQYSPVGVATATNNDPEVSLAGMVIKSVTNIFNEQFPSMNVAAGLTDIPILKFVAKSVGLKTRLNSLVISNDSKTFDSNGNNTGITKLKWVKDDSGGEYSGYGLDGPGSSPNLDTLLSDALFAKNDSSTATFTYDDADVDIADGAEQTFYILADFGANMRAGQTVSLNISANSRVAADKDGDLTVGDVDDSGYTALKIGSSLPLTVTPTQSITVVDPQLLIKTPLDVAIGGNGVGLFFDTEDMGGVGATKKLVAGMYDVLMYVFDFDAASDLSGVTFEFQSPNGYFSQESIGISKLSLYRDEDNNGALGSGDIFLGSTDVFTNAGKTGTISNVSLPEGKDQKLLLLFDIGQRVSDSTDELSVQLSNVIASDNVVAGMFPNPIVPYTYDVVAHKLEITHLFSDIPDTNVITQASTFDVRVLVNPTAAGATNKIQLVQVGSTGVPLSSPKFYLGGVSGSNRTYEFSQTFLPDESFAASKLFDNYDTTTMLGEGLNLAYRVSAENITSEGNYLIDFDVYYKMTHADYLTSSKTTNDPVNIRLTRSKGIGTNYKSAVELSNGSSQKITPSMTTTNKVYTWSLPAYIESVEVQVNNTFTSFNNYQSVPQNAQLKIQFIDNGQDIDSSSLSLQLNGTTLKSESEVFNSSEVYYEYDALSGELLVTSIGDASGTLTVSANDNFGQAYPSAPLIFFTSATLEIEKFFVYPNPFSPSIRSSGMTFGFSLTQAATVSIKVYDAMGREITRVSPQILPMGYQTINWDAIIASSSKFIPSGTYYLKLTATDSEGASKVATTKLAVY